MNCCGVHALPYLSLTIIASGKRSFTSFIIICGGFALLMPSQVVVVTWRVFEMGVKLKRGVTFFLIYFLFIEISFSEDLLTDAADDVVD